MEKINDLLHSIGLSTTEIEIYQTALPYAAIGVADLVKKTGIKRPTVYHALHTLAEKGLVSKKTIGAKTVFSLTNPAAIERLIEQKIFSLQQKKDEMKELTPLLLAHTAATPGTVRISHYEGVDGIKTLFEEAYYCRSKRWDIIAPSINFLSEYDSTYAKYYLTKRHERGIKVRTLWEQSPGKFNSKKLSPAEILERNPRYLPENMNGRFTSLIILFDDAVALISSIKEVSGVLIQSSDFSMTFKALFDTVWEISTPYEVFQKQQKV